MNKNEFKNWLKDRLPSLPEYDTQEADDLFSAIAGVYSEIHTEIGNIASSIDVDNTERKYLPELAKTLGIQDKIASKITFKAVGGRTFNSDFEDYSIYTRIEQKIAYDAEIRLLRDFIKSTLHRNLSKGTPNSLENLFQLLNVDAVPLPRWTDDYPNDTTEILDVFGLTEPTDTLNGFVINNGHWANLVPEKANSDGTPSVRNEKIKDYNAKRTVVDAAGGIQLAFTDPDQLSRQLDDGTLEMSFSYSDETPSRKVHLLLRGQKSTSAGYEIDEYYVAGIGKPISGSEDDPKLVIAKISYEDNREFPYYEILASSDTKAEDIPVGRRIKLDVSFEDENIEVKLFEGFSPGGETQPTETLSADLNIIPEKVKKWYFNGTCFLTNQKYDIIEKRGSYGFRVQNCQCSVFSYSARPKKSWPTEYSYEKELRQTKKPYFLDYYSADVFKYDNVHGLYQTNFSTISDFSWTHFKPSNGTLNYITAGFAYDTSTETATVTSQTTETSATTSQTTGASGDSSGIYSLTDTEQLRFETKLLFQFSSFLEEAGIAFGIEDEFSDGQWKKGNTLLKVEFNKWGFDLVLSKVHNGNSTYLAGANLSYDLAQNTIYELKIVRDDGNPVYLSEITGTPSDTETFDSPGSRIKISFGPPENTETIIDYNANRKDAYFYSTTAQTTATSSYSSTVRAASAYYDRLGVLRGVPPDIAHRNNPQSCYTDFDLIQKKDPTGNQMGLLSRNQNMEFRWFEIHPKDSDTNYTYDDVGNFTDRSSLLSNLSDFYPYDLCSLSEKNWYTSTVTPSATGSTTTQTSGASATHTRHVLDSDIEKIQHTTGRESNMIVQVGSDIYVRRADENRFQKVVSEVEDFVTSENNVVVLKTDGKIEIYDSNLDSTTEPIFETAQSAQFSLNEHLDRRNMGVKSLFENEETVLVVLEHDNMTDGVRIGDKTTWKKISSAGNETFYGDVEDQSGSDIYKLNISNGKAVFSEHLKIPKFPSKIHLIQQNSNEKNTFFVYEENGNIHLDVINQHSSWSKDSTDAPPYYSFTDSICRTSQFMGVFRSYAFEDTLFFLYTDSDDETHVTTYDENARIMVDNKIAEDVQLFDVIQVYDALIFYGRDNDLFEKMFVLWEMNTRTGDFLPEGKNLNLQAFNLPEHPPYTFRDVSEGWDRTNWYISGTMEPSGSQNFSTQSVPTSGENIVFSVLKVQSDATLMGQLDSTDSENLLFSSRFKINSISTGDQSICKIFDDESGRYIHLTYNDSTDEIKADFNLYNRITETYPSDSGTFDLADGNNHSVVGGMIRDEGSMRLVVAVDGNVVINSPFTLISDFNVSDLHNEIWDESYDKRLVLGNWLEVELFGGDINAEVGWTSILSGNAMSQSWTKDFSYHLHPRKFSIAEKGSTGSADGINNKRFSYYMNIGLENGGTEKTDYPVFIQLRGEDIDFTTLKEGKNIRITSERGSENYLPFDILGIDKTNKIVTIGVVTENISDSENNLTIYYGSDYNDKLNNFQQDGTPTTYLNFTENSWEMLSGGYLNTVSESGTGLEGIRLNPNEIDSPPVGSQKEKGYLLYGTKDRPIILSRDISGIEKWTRLNNLGFFGQKNLWSSKDFDLSITHGTDLTSARHRTRLANQRSVETETSTPPASASSGDQHLVTQDTFPLKKTDADENTFTVEGESTGLEDKIFRITGTGSNDGTWTLRSNSTYDSDNDQTLLPVKENVTKSTSDSGTALMAQGVWGGKANYIAYYNGHISGWEYTEPNKSIIVYIKEYGTYKVWNGTDWVGYVDMEITGMPDLSHLRNYLNDFVDNQKPAYTTWSALLNYLEYVIVDYLYEKNFQDDGVEYNIRI